MTQIDLGGNPLDAKPADDVYPEDVKCAHYDEESGACNRYAVIGVRLEEDTFPRYGGYTPACPRHAKGAWLHAAGVAEQYMD